MDLLVIPGLDNSERLRELRLESKGKSKRALDVHRAKMAFLGRGHPEAVPHKKG